MARSLIKGPFIHHRLNSMPKKWTLQQSEPVEQVVKSTGISQSITRFDRNKRDRSSLFQRCCSLKQGLNEGYSVTKNVAVKANQQEKEIGRTVPAKKLYTRNSFISPLFMDREFEVHNGKTFTRHKVSVLSIGHKFGEFSLTRKKFVYKKKLKKRNKK